MTLHGQAHDVICYCRYLPDTRDGLDNAACMHFIKSRGRTSNNLRIAPLCNSGRVLFSRAEVLLLACLFICWPCVSALLAYQTEAGLHTNAMHHAADGPRAVRPAPRLSSVGACRLCKKQVPSQKQHDQRPAHMPVP
jgi:hypothetical protein